VHATRAAVALNASGAGVTPSSANLIQCVCTDLAIGGGCLDEARERHVRSCLRRERTTGQKRHDRQARSSHTPPNPHRQVPSIDPHGLASSMSDERAVNYRRGCPIEGQACVLLAGLGYFGGNLSGPWQLTPQFGSSTRHPPRSARTRRALKERNTIGPSDAVTPMAPSSRRQPPIEILASI
jgi:hypothetical protein